VERTRFEEELRALGEDLRELAGLAAARLDLAMRALFERLADAALQVIAHDAELSEVQLTLDDRAMKLLALQQPAARDLRLIVSGVKAGADLERIGDHAVNIAQTALLIIGRPPVATESRLQTMGQVAAGMLRDALTAFDTGDAEQARAVLARDHEVDTARRDVFRELLDQVRREPAVTEQCVSLMLVSRNLERVADHATNIAEDAIFLVSARDVRHQPELRATIEDPSAPRDLV
jgi:phosphate transport system protein